MKSLEQFSTDVSHAFFFFLLHRNRKKLYLPKNFFFLLFAHCERKYDSMHALFHNSGSVFLGLQNVCCH